MLSKKARSCGGDLRSDSKWRAVLCSPDCGTGPPVFAEPADCACSVNPPPRTSVRVQIVFLSRVLAERILSILFPVRFRSAPGSERHCRRETISPQTFRYEERCGGVAWQDT